MINFDDLKRHLNNPENSDSDESNSDVVEFEYEDEAVRNTELLENTSDIAPQTRDKINLSFVDGAFYKTGSDKKYFFKPKPLESAQFEAYCAAIHRFIVTEKYVPNYKAFKGSMDPIEQSLVDIFTVLGDSSLNPFFKMMYLTECFVKLKMAINLKLPNDLSHGVASPAIHFVSNYEAPLKEQDLMMNCQPFLDEFLLNRLKRLLRDNINVIEANRSELSIAQKTFSFFSPTEDMKQAKFCENMLISMDEIDDQFLQEALQASFCPDNLKPLLRAWKQKEPDIEAMSIALLEKFDAQYPQALPEEALTLRQNEKEIVIPAKLLAQYRLIKGLGRTLIVRSIFDDWDTNNSNISKTGQMLDFEYSKMSVLMAGVFFQTFQKLLNKATKHEENEMDIEEFNELISSEVFQEAFKFLGFNRSQWSAQSISDFPDIGDSNPYMHYHPTKRFYFNRLLFGIVTSLLIKCRDAEQSEVMQSLSENIKKVLYVLEDAQSRPGYLSRLSDACYLGFATLKRAVTGSTLVEAFKKEQHQQLYSVLINKWKEFYQQHHELFEQGEQFFLEQLGSKTKIFSAEDNKVYTLLQDHPVFIFHKNVSLLKYILTSAVQYQALADLYLDNNMTKSLLIQNEAISLEKLREVLLSTAQFQKFILEQGDEAMEIIMAEFAELKSKCESKLDKKPYYHPFVDGLNLESMQQQYLKIKEKINDEALQLDADEENRFVY